MRKIYAIFDSKSNSYDGLFVSSGHGAALRSFADLATRGDSMVSRYPSDFYLYHIGTWDDDGSLIPESATQLACASEYKRDASSGVAE